MDNVINQKYVSNLLFKVYWQSVDLGATSPGDMFSKSELELIVLYNNHHPNHKDAYLLMVERDLREGNYSNV